MARLLVADDERSMRELLELVFKREGHQVTSVSNGREALAALAQSSCDLIITDVKMPDLNGIELLKAVRDQAPDTMVIMMTAFATINSAREAFKLGADDFIQKPFDVDEFKLIVRKALEKRDLRQENALLKRELHRRGQLGDIIGRSPKMQAVYQMIETVAANSSTVLVNGESGTGKELVARAIHNLSARRDRPFVSVNCGAFTETLLESELFGHVRGAFTGAAASHRGIFETASGGTVFLDEISETSPAFQVRLLRVLQEQEVRPVGASEPRRVDVRIVAATNRRVQDLLSADDFRQDLLYRLSVIHIELPPLRQRREDIPLLIEHFLQRASRRLQRQVQVTPDTMNWLSGLAWPGNVRELENAVERAVTLNASGQLLPEDFTQFTPAPFITAPELSAAMQAAAEPQPETAAEAPPHAWVCRVPATLDEIEREHIIATLRYTGGNKLRAAELLGIGRYSLYRKAERLGLNLDSLTSKHKSEQ